MNEQQRYKELQKVSFITIVINAVLAAAKVAVGLVTGSVSVISDGVHTLSDVGTTIIVLVGLFFSKGAADDDHPYGHQRIESLVSVLLALALGATAVLIGYDGGKKLLEGLHVAPSVSAIVVTVASIAVKEWMYHYTLKAANKLNSLSLKADAWHHRSDAVSSVAVLVGVGGNMLGVWWLEPVAALAVAFMILWAAIEILRGAFSQLVDHSVDGETIESVREVALGVDGVLQIDDLRTRISGNVVFVDIDIAVDAELTVTDAHKIAENVHDAVENSPFKVSHCMVHVNPRETPA